MNDVAVVPPQHVQAVDTRARMERRVQSAYFFINRVLGFIYSLRDVERRPVLCSFKRVVEGGSSYQKIS